VADGASTLPAPDRAALLEFQKKVARLQRAVAGALETANSIRTRLGLMKRALQETPSADYKLTEQATSIEKRINDILRDLRGDNTLASRSENTPPSISQRVNGIISEQSMSTSKPTTTQMEQYDAASQDFKKVLADLRSLAEGDLVKLEKAMEAAGAPHTPGRIPEWKDN
jgi:chromosome segregation ATPase